MRYPVAGTTKTRLIPALGASGAAHVSKKLTEHALQHARQSGYPLALHGTGASRQTLEQWLGTPCQLQQGEDLGARMRRAIAEAAATGATRLILMGSDCPALTTEIICEGFALLDSHDVVFGPAVDGGYYLIGMRALHQQLFDDMSWSHDQVLAQSLTRLGTLSHGLLPPLHDIDTPADLIHLPPGFLP